ncbi:MAG: FkbM family methyltransferase [Lentisphaerae bacterium]|nr:FkbM family methyltransferase [Lentisphaerota bacterium]
MSEIKTFGSHLVNIDLFPENPVIIDAGACQGNFIDDIRRLVKDPLFLAIEPSNSNFRYLIEKYNISQREVGVVFIPAALVGEDEPKKMEFVEFEGLPEWGNVSGLYSRPVKAKYDVETTTLREVLGLLPKVPISLLKMDIEACEHKVVEDMTFDQAKRIQQITMEVHEGLRGMQSKLEWLGYDTKFENGELYGVRKKL